MSITDSRLKGGALTLDANPFAKQANSIELTPTSSADGDEIETLSGDTIEPEEETAWTLDLGVIQDFDDADGLIEFARANAGTVVPFTLKPNSGVLVYSGTVRVRPIKIGGGVAARLTSDTSWPVIGEPTPDYTP